MGILYLDEAGNTGLWDKDQIFLIYGGPYISAKKWKTVNDELIQVQIKYKSLIMGRFQSGINPTTNFSRLEYGVQFLSEFSFHARDIANKRGLWSKLNDHERFQVMTDIIDIMEKRNIVFYLGVLDKRKIRPKRKPKKNNMIEYKILLKSFFDFVENELDEEIQITTIMDDGDPVEKDIIKEKLRNTSQIKFLGELVPGKSVDYPILQIADIGIWIFQAYHRLGNDRKDRHAKRVRQLYRKLCRITRVHWC